MRFHNIVLKIVFLALMVSTVTFPCLAETMVSPYSADFGGVLIGNSSTIPVAITNLERSDSLTVSISFMDGQVGFSTLLNELQLQPGQTVNLDVRYSPSNVGTNSDVLMLMDNMGQAERIFLTGQGIEAPKQMGLGSILEFFENSVRNETLKGIGPGKSADNRLNALHNLLVSADKFMERGDLKAACGQLAAVLKKIDYEGAPTNSAKFVGGDSAQELASMIEETLKSGSLSKL